MPRSRLVRLCRVAAMLLLLPALLPSAQAEPPACFGFDICESCSTNPATARHCNIVQCPFHTSRRCGACVSDCVTSDL